MDQIYVQNLPDCDPHNIFCGKIFRNIAGSFNYLCTYCEQEFTFGLDFESHVIGHFLEEKCAEPFEETWNEIKKRNLQLVDEVEPLACFDALSNKDEHEDDKIVSRTRSRKESILKKKDVLKTPPPVEESSKAPESPSDVLVKSEKSTDPKANNIKCVCCYQKFTCNGLRDIHLHQSYHPYMKCEQCPTFFPDRKSRRTHIRLHQKPENVLFKCPHCSRILPTEDSLNKHISVNQKPDILPENPAKLDRVQEPVASSYECDICNRKFKVKFYLEKHLLKHTQNQLDCHICKMQFRTNGVLRYHMQKHTGEKIYKCTICDKSFLSPTYVKQHMRLHSGEKPFVCQKCGKAFFCCSSLTRHIRLTHERIRNHVCEICSERFITPGSLKDHVRSIHTDEKPFSCPDCDRTFARSKTLRQHRLLHDVKKFKCNYCEKYFAQSAGRRGHEKHFHRAA